jgi:hypothetical protein
MLKWAMVCCTPPRAHDLDRMADRLDADLVDGELARILELCTSGMLRRFANLGFMLVLW